MSAQAGTPGRKKRENNFHEPGVRGRQVVQETRFTTKLKRATATNARCRKTGLVLKDTGVRDKDGLEPIEGIFSSPEKSAVRDSRKSNTTLTDSEDMEVGESRLRAKIQ